MVSFVALAACAILGTAGLEPGMPAEILSWRHQIRTPEEYTALAGEWEAWVKAHPANARGWVEWGDALRYTGKWQDAQDAYRRAYEADSTDVAAIIAHFAIGGTAPWDTQRLELERAARLAPDAPDVYYSLWFAALCTGDPGRADECLRRVVALGDLAPPLLDFGANLLEGCPENAILFTNGDNDTYPVLAWQVLTGRRRDVLVTNISCANVPRYLKDQRRRGLPLGMSEAEVDSLVWTKEASVSTQIQRAVIGEWKSGRSARPVCYSVAVPSQSRAEGEWGFRLEGLVVRLAQQGTPPPARGEDDPIDLARTREVFDTVVRLDSALDPLFDWERDNALAKLAQNYIVVLARIGSGLASEGRAAEAEPYRYRAVELAAFHGYTDFARGIVAEWEKGGPEGRLLRLARTLVAPR